MKTGKNYPEERFVITLHNGLGMFVADPKYNKGEHTTEIAYAKKFKTSEEAHLEKKSLEIFGACVQSFLIGDQNYVIYSKKRSELLELPVFLNHNFGWVGFENADVFQSDFKITGDAFNKEDDVEVITWEDGNKMKEEALLSLRIKNYGSSR